MNSADAQAWLERWQDKHKGEDLIVREGGELRPTHQGKVAVRGLLRYDIDDVNEAGAAAELGNTGYVKFAHVFAQLRKSAQAEPQKQSAVPQYLYDLTSGVPEHVRGVPVYINIPGGTEFGIFEFRGSIPCVWILQQRFDAAHRQGKPEWVWMPPAQMTPGLIKRLPADEAATLTKRWLAMEAAHEFYSFAPSHCYRPREANQKTAEQMREELRHATFWQTEQTGGPARSLAEIMSPGLAKQEPRAEPWMAPVLTQEEEDAGWIF